MFENFKYYYWYYKYRLKFMRWIWYDWYVDGSMVKSDVIKILKRMNRDKFIIHMKTEHDDRFPFFYNLYWAYKYACKVSRVNYEYVYFNAYIESVIEGVRPTPKWMVNEFPTETHMLGLIPCSNAINERKKDLKYEIKFRNYVEYGKRDAFTLHGQCDMHDWLIENCNGEWYFNSFAGSITIQFTDEADAMAFKLRWL